MFRQRTFALYRYIVLWTYLDTCYGIWFSLTCIIKKNIRAFINHCDNPSEWELLTLIDNYKCLLFKWTSQNNSTLSGEKLEQNSRILTNILITNADFKGLV